MSKQELFLIVLTFSVWIASLKMPFYGAAYFYLYYALKYNYLFISLRSFRPLFVTPLIAFVSITFIHKKRLVFTPQVVILALFFLWMCLSRFMNGYNIWEGEEIEPFSKVVIFLFLITSLIDTKEKLIYFLWIMATASVVLGYVARYNDSISPYYFVDRNNFAFSLLASVAFTAIIALNEKKWLRKLEAVLYFLIVIYSIAGTNSRGGYLGLGAVFLFLVLSNFNLRKIPLLMIPIIIVLSRMSSTHWERLFSVSVDPEQGGTGGQRLALWNTALRMLFENPIFGVGSGESGPLFSQYADIKDQFRVGGQVGYESIKVHNMTLQIGSEMGFIGLGMFFFLVIFCFFNILEVRNLCRKNTNVHHLKFLADILGVSLIGLLVSGQFANFGYNLQFYTLMCLVPVLKKIVVKTHRFNLEGKTVDEEPVVPAKWELPLRCITLVILTYMSLRL